MQNNKLHLVSFSSPFPADYGGAIDIFYKIKNLSIAGVDIILHVFVEDESKPIIELESICFKVFYYKRTDGLSKVFSLTPFIVKTRVSKKLVSVLREDNYPIVLEGTHSSYILQFPDLRNRCFLRLHNIESNYYNGLYRIESNLIRKVFFRFESWKLVRYERKIFQSKILFFPISGNDDIYLSKLGVNSELVRPFHSNDTLLSKLGRGNYILYHGNLMIMDNELSARRIIEYSRDLKIRLVIAGRKAGMVLDNIVMNDYLEIIDSPSDDIMNNLIENAHINIVFSNQSDGLKLKLVNSLFRGRFCIANSKSLTDVKLENLVTKVDSKDDYIEAINDLMGKEFCQDDFNTRLNGLQPFSNSFNASIIIHTIKKAQGSSRP